MSKTDWTPKKLRQKADLYFAKRDAEFKPYTISGLIVYLGITGYRFEKWGKTKEYKSTIKYIRTTIEDHIISNALNNTYNSGFAQFILKSMDRDKYVTETKTKVDAKVTSKVSPIAQISDQIRAIAERRAENPPQETIKEGSEDD